MAFKESKLANVGRAPVAPEKERYGSLPSRLANAWREYSSDENKMSLSKDIELVDAIMQVFQDRLTVEDLGTQKFAGGQWVDEEAYLYGKILELVGVRKGLIEAEDKRAVREKQYYTAAEMALLMQAVVMAVNEEAPDVRERIKTRLANSPIGSILKDPR